jgi:hypothetical protein
LNPNAINTIVANVTSTSNPHGVLVTLTETGPNTGMFKGNFSFTSSTSGTALQVKPGDKITVHYNGSLARLTETLNGVTQPGTAIITDINLNPGAPGVAGVFTPLGGAASVTLVGVQSSPGTIDTVTMSYANVPLHGQDPNSLLIFESPAASSLGWRQLDNCVTDTTAKTVTCQTTTLRGLLPTGPAGLFSLGVPGGISGGGGGGLAPFQSGVVIDLVAPIVAGSSGGGGGGGTGGGGTPPPPPPTPTPTSPPTPTPTPATTTTTTKTITKTSPTSPLATGTAGAPTVNNLTVVTNASQPVAITLQAGNSTVNSTLTFTVVSAPVLGTLGKITGATVMYTPGPNLANAADSFTYKATNSAGLSSNIGTVTIMVNPHH